MCDLYSIKTTLIIQDHVSENLLTFGKIVSMKSSISTRPRIVLVNRSVVLHPNDKKFLIIQRTNTDWNGNKWELPGGKLDDGQDIANAVEREVFEETGLLSIPINRMAYFESYLIPKGKYKGLTFVSIIGVSKASNKDVKLSNEHQDFRWIYFENMNDYELVDETRKALISLQELIEKQFN